ncbi:UPF0175 family protein [Leptolyngbya cf. ectocarpi LEGE 11479]|uniref:UPF0175 family protein n=1 Tax=Leptolyngbya cf. ectocarpi LEGE 11479 TaxID=1828722 RepID=A0A928X3Y0_LEPEC|nr:UPF0175 family protein [Leptolyngbya ectocarpi]MBE9066648.1 UPF0175 family protein [Leptolyngbya cf. ectocarpi LEGE 11479]
MNIQLAIPDEFADALTLKWGSVEKKLLEFAVIEAYREGIIGLVKVAELLNMESRWEAEEFLVERGIDIPYDMEDFEQDLATLQRL